MPIGDKPIATLDDVLVELKSLNSKKKDFWDRLGPLSAFISSVVLGVASLWFTQSYNNRQAQVAETQSKQDQETKKHQARVLEHQARVLEMQAIEKFMPYLTTKNNEEQKALAIFVINALGSPELAIHLAELYPSQGTQAAADKVMASAVASGIERGTPPVVSELSSPADKGVGMPTPTRKFGWVYLGHFVPAGHKWQTQYFEFPSSAEPSSLVSRVVTVRAEKGNINVRLGMPTEAGQFLGIRDVLKPGGQVKVREVREWSSAGYIWAEIEYET